MDSSTDLDRRRLILASAAVAAFGAALGASNEAKAGQPYMQGALKALYNAQTSLNEAAHDKGGHRENALNLVNQAIEEVKAGIAVGAM